MILSHTDELLLKLAEGKLSKESKEELFRLAEGDSVLRSKMEDYLSLVELEDELTTIDSAISADFTDSVMLNLEELSGEQESLKRAFIRSFQGTFAALTCAILLIGPGSVVNKTSTLMGLNRTPGTFTISDSFQTVSVTPENLKPGKAGKAEELEVLIELIAGDRSQREFVSGILRVDSRSSGEAVLILPDQDSKILKEIDRRISL